MKEIRFTPRETREGRSVLTDSDGTPVTVTAMARFSSIGSSRVKVQFVAPVEVEDADGERVEAAVEIGREFRLEMN